MSKHYTKETVNAEYKNLDAWKKSPRGYAVAVCPDIAHVEVDDSWKNVQLVRVNTSLRSAAKALENFRRRFDDDPNGFSPRLFVMTREVFEDPRNEQFVRRAMVIIERF